ncbi:MAG: class I SAM-dependent methyltransferase [Acidobacteria bacterium]|nr:class I SAM-dependent methyltransferase [Acidobacteriota bacterium]
MRNILFRLLDPLARAERLERVLDAGCGTGYLAKFLAARYGWRMVGVDLGFPGLRYARGLGLSHLVQADISRMPFSSCAFDAAISMDVIVHLPRGQEGAAFAELARVVRPGGLIALRVAALEMLRSRHSRFIDERQRFTRGRLLACAQKAGIETLRCTYANSMLLPVALAKFRIWEPLLRKSPASGVAGAASWANRALYLPLEAEAALIGAGMNFPLGQSLFLLGRRRP